MHHHHHHVSEKRLHDFKEIKLKGKCGRWLSCYQLNRIRFGGKCVFFVAVKLVGGFSKVKQDSLMMPLTIVAMQELADRDADRVQPL